MAEVSHPTPEPSSAHTPFSGLRNRLTAAAAAVAVVLTPAVVQPARRPVTFQVDSVSRLQTEENLHSTGQTTTINNLPDPVRDTDGKLVQERPNPLPGGIKQATSRDLPRRKPIAAFLQPRIDAAPPELVGQEFWNAIQAAKNYTFENNFNVLQTEFPTDTTTPIRSNPLLETLVLAAEHAQKHGIKDAADLLGGYDETNDDQDERYFVGGIINYLAADLGRVATGKTQDQKLKDAKDQLGEAGHSVPNRYIYAQALAVPHYGPYTTANIARSVMDFNFGFPEHLMPYTVQRLDALVSIAQRGTSDKVGVDKLGPSGFPDSDSQLLEEIRRAADSPRQPKETKQLAEKFEATYNGWVEENAGIPIKDVTPFSTYCDTHDAKEFNAANAWALRGVAATDFAMDNKSLPGKNLAITGNLFVISY